MASSCPRVVSLRVLHEKGYVSFAIGKWHLVPIEEGTMSGPFDRWPLGRGFDRFYGFLGAKRISLIQTWSMTIIPLSS